MTWNKLLENSIPKLYRNSFIKKSYRKTFILYHNFYPSFMEPDKKQKEVI